MSLQARHEADADVQVTEVEVTATLRDARDSTVTLFAGLDAEQAHELALDAWTIGLKALRNAAVQADEARLADVGRSLVEDVEKQLSNHLKQQEERVQWVLRGYFDPQDGKVSERLQSFVKDDGELARLLQRFSDPDDGELAKTLAARLGESSPIFRLLSPTDSQGIVHQLEKRFQETLEDNKTQLRTALDPSAEDSPVQRFLASLQRNLKAHDEDREKQLRELTKALDAGDEDSLLNQMRRDVANANVQLIKAINPEDPDSSMAKIRDTITRMVSKHMEENKELLEASEKRQRLFQTEVTTALARLEKQKEETARSTFGGFDYEDAVTRFVEEAVRGGPYHVEATGNTPGAIRGSKKGDQVVRFTAEHAFADSGLVLESKRAANYTVARALEELAEARKNRDCQAGVFVLAAKSASVGFPRFARYGQDVLVTWDDEDRDTDAYLHAAILTGLALVTRTGKKVDTGDIEALHDIEKRVRSEIDRLEKMETWTSNIHRDAGKIDDEIRKGKKALDLLVRKGADVLKALDVEMREEEAERDPITLGPESLDRARDAVRSSGDGVNGQHDEASDDDLSAGWKQHVSIEAPGVPAFRADRRRVDDPDDDAGDGDESGVEGEDYEEV